MIKQPNLAKKALYTAMTIGLLSTAGFAPVATAEIR